MNKLNKKQKIILIVIIIFIIVGYGYYSYTKENVDLTENDLGIVESENVETQDSPETKEKIKIHLLGAVKKEGILELEEGSRIADAIEMAGGCKENACVNEINLAYLLEDGMKIKIPTNEEVEANKKAEVVTEYISNESGTQNAKDSSGTTVNNKEKNKSTTSSKININSANETELQELQGIGPSTAKSIVDYRNENGKFKSVTDIKSVKGIGESKFNKIKDFITI